jgi:hypothetical protein
VVLPAPASAVCSLLVLWAVLFASSIDGWTPCSPPGATLVVWSKGILKEHGDGCTLAGAASGRGHSSARLSRRSETRKIKSSSC